MLDVLREPEVNKNYYRREAELISVSNQPDPWIFSMKFRIPEDIEEWRLHETVTQPSRVILNTFPPSKQYWVSGQQGH